VFYLACAPQLFGPICARAAAHGLVDATSRVVLEKPIGVDLDSARTINDQVGAVFTEEQIFRIDHYLGKETVQNLLVLRFANALLEPLWNAGHIDHVQISVAESIGVGGRADYYDGSGALRDMVQNHLLQLLCLVAMEPPAALDREAVRDEKLKVLQSLRPLTGATALRKTVRGQYGAGLTSPRRSSR
jgi:glucose-6-phosphate 1-dehydrogenase